MRMSEARSATWTAGLRSAPAISLSSSCVGALHGVVGDAGVEIDAGADAALVQVGPAVGLLRRQAQHGHRRLVAVDDDAHVRNALVTDGREVRMQANALLHDGRVRLGAQRV